MVHSRRGTPQDYNHEQSPRNPLAAEDWWRTGTQDEKLSERTKRHVQRFLRLLSRNMRLWRKKYSVVDTIFYCPD